MTSPPGEPSSEPAEPPARSSPSAMAFVGLGTTVAGCVAVGVGLGIFLDGRAHTSPLFLLLGLLLGVGAAVASVVVQVRRFL